MMMAEKYPNMGIWLSVWSEHHGPKAPTQSPKTPTQNTTQKPEKTPLFG